ncbi:tetratricopeptide repeat protein [Kibdelosporangium philippinense]|uniref:Tetratricopeptide repeat protein n=1 Tax=Kibdelosporangium philippinense TaxID=211113 RepID=A0ABS8ZSK4_9PSEU|nr:tetratricopeptide repeat protein [Kibdelosporangium philippinense]MCE7010681.1 tetratricopeptide repeat protein [Kibdelosporangium philippinense]
MTTDDGVAVLAAARAALDSGDLPEATALGDNAIQVLAAECGAEHPDTANAQLLLASVHEQLGHFDQAKRSATIALSILDKYATSSLRTVMILRVRAEIAVANLDRISGDFEAARARMSTTLGRLEPGDPLAAGVHNVLGIVGKFTGEFDEAQAHYLRALELHEDNPLGMAAILHNLGGLEHERRRPEAGIPWAERGLEIRRNVRPPDHPDIAADLGALGSLYLSAGRLDDAEKAFRQAISIFTADYEIAVVRGNLAHLQARQGRIEQAEDNYRAALAGKRKALGDDHPDIAVTAHNLGVLLFDAGRQAEGRELIEHALDLLTARFPADHPRVVAIARTLATL